MIELIPNWHPVWVHFAIALLVTGAVGHTLALIRKSQGGGMPQALIVGRWTLWFGVLGAGLALLTGFWAAGSVTHDDAAHANMMVHRNWAIATTVLFALAAAFEWLRRVQLQASVVTVALCLAGVVAIGVTGYEGGQNVFEYGLGVQRLPDVSSHDHNAAGHGHGDSVGNDADASGDHEHAESTDLDPGDSDGHGHGDTSRHDTGDSSGHEYGDSSGNDAGELTGHEHGDLSEHDLGDADGHGHGDSGHDAGDPDGHGHSDSTGHEDGAHDHGDQASGQPAADDTQDHDHAGHDHGGAEISSSLSVDTGPMADLAARFSAALVAGDQAAVAQLVNPDVLIFESGNVESSRAEYEGDHMLADMAFLAALEVELISRKVIELGNNGAVVSSRSRLFGHYKDRDIDVLSTETLVLKKTNGKWRIVHIHWSSNS